MPKKQRLIIKGEAKDQIKSIMGNKYKKDFSHTAK